MRSVCSLSTRKLSERDQNSPRRFRRASVLLYVATGLGTTMECSVRVQPLTLIKPLIIRSRVAPPEVRSLCRR